jgi:hypothetical protein
MLTSRRLPFACLLFAGVVLGSFAQAGSYSPAAILQGATIFGRFDAMEIEAEMAIRDSRSTKSRGLAIAVEHRQNGTTRVLARVVSPGFLSRMKYLVHHHENGREDAWLSTSRGVRRLTGARRQVRLFDSDFTAEDFAPLDTGSLDLQLIEGAESPCSGCVGIRAREQSGSQTTRLLFVEQGTGLIHQVDYLDRSGDLVRRYELVATQTIRGQTVPRTCRMEDFERESVTTLRFTSVKLPDSVPARLLNPGSL